MSRQFKTKEFKALEDLWYLRLKKEGFEDIEQSPRHLKWSPSQVLNRSIKQHKTVFHESREEYYRLAGHFLHEHTFANETEQFVWEKHAEGATLRDIAAMLTKKGTKITLTPVKEMVHKLRDLMFKKYKGNDNG